LPSKATILIVDDAPAGRQTLEELLISQDYELAFAGDGPEALAKAGQLTPDLILLDVMMPGMDGFEVCWKLRANPRLAEVPIIMVTALDDRDSRLHGIVVGADDFVTKPFDRDELRARVRTVIRLNRYRRLLAERAQFEWVVEQADEGYLVVSDRDEVVYANPKACLYLGVLGDTQEPIAEKFLTLAQKQYRCEPEEAWLGWPAQSAERLQHTRYLLRPESPTARAFWLEVTILSQPAGLDTQRLVRLRDVTTQMANKRDIRTFHLLIAHKLRTPLTTIQTGVVLLADEAPTLSADEIAFLAQSAAQGVLSLRAAIEDILQYLEVPALAHSGASFTLGQLASLATQISAGLGLASVTISGDERLGNVEVALSDRAVEWVLWELLENAKKFHPRQSPAVEIVVARSSDSAVSLRIADDGLNLSPEQLAQVWTPYYQGEKYFTGQATGMGLGLPLVASLVWESGGSCRLYNREEGPGVVVELILPAAQEAC
jgi:DNA-binding response OmpR family regulator